MLCGRDAKAPQVPVRRNSYVQLSQSFSYPSHGTNQGPGQDRWSFPK